MRIVIAPDKFKGSLMGQEVCAAIASGIRKVDGGIDLDLCAVADGGEGIARALVEATGGRFVTRRVTGPLVDMKVEATFGMLGDTRAESEISRDVPLMTAVIEMAAASGLSLLKQEERNPLNTTTFGTGELMMEAVRLGARRIILGIGGSATIDGGIGCAQACGLPVILDGEASADVREPLVGGDLGRVVLVKHGRGSPIEAVEILVACDVANPLFGENGAAKVYGKQKGATDEQIAKLDDLLKRLAERCRKMDEANAAGAGAAGGVGFAMLAFFGAKLRPGFEVVAEAIGLRERLDRADLCFTGEGKLDESSLQGKAPIGVARMCQEMNVPCVAIVGTNELQGAALHKHGVSACFSICDGPMDLEFASKYAAELVAKAAENAFRLWAAARHVTGVLGRAKFAQEPIEPPEV